MTKPVRIAVIGAGLIGARHMAYVANCPDAALVAVADPDPAAATLAARNSCPHWSDPAAMLVAGGIDGAIVATPTVTHEDVGRSCIEAGIHAIIEKPICHTLAAAERLNQAAEAAGIALLTGHHRRYNPCVAQAQALIAEGHLGQMIGVNVMFAIAKPAAYFSPDWRRAPGAGPILTNLIHDIDLLRTILGEIVQVSALTSSAQRGFATEDSAVISLRFASGAIGSIFVTDTAPSPWTWEQGTGESHPQFPRNTENAYRFFGTEGALEFPQLKLWRQDGGPDWTKEITPKNIDVPEVDVYAAQVAHFARVIRGTEAPIISGREGQRSLAATLAIFQAAETGRTIDL
ncbi:MAG: Gfo/Idh/MocA family oxidoreductase [Pseudomonadota bacterium]